MAEGVPHPLKWVEIGVNNPGALTYNQKAKGAEKEQKMSVSIC